MKGMKSVWKLVLVLGVLWHSGGAFSKSGYIFGITPWDKPDKLKAMWQPMMDHLAKELGTECKILVTQDYPGLTKAVQRKTVDFALYSPKAYVSATKIIPELKYMVTALTVNDDGKVVDNYKGLVVATKNSNIKSFSDIKGKRFAFTDKESSSGFAYPESRLRKHGIDYTQYFSKVLFLKKHQRVMGALASNSIDVGATWDGAYKNGVKKYGAKFIIIDSVPIPNDPIAAAPHVPAEVVGKVQSILLSQKKDGPVMKAMAKNGYPDVGYSRRSDSFYDVVRGLSKK